MAAQAVSRFMPWRSSTRSGSAEPTRSFLSQLPSSVFSPMGTDFGGTVEEGCAECFTSFGAFAVPYFFSVCCGADASRDKGRIVPATRAHSCASSGLSDRTRGDPFRDQDQDLAIR